METPCFRTVFVGTLGTKRALGCRQALIVEMECMDFRLTDRQIELVNTFADQAVIAIESTRLFEEVQARTREITRLQ